MDALGTLSRSGGAIQVKSTPGQGTTFSLYFPLAVPLAPHGRVKPSPRPSEPEPTCVLPVDDEALVRRTLRNVLAARSYDVHESDGLAGALALLAHTPVDVVVSDVHMPGGSGFELMARLAERAPDLPAVLMSGYVTPEPMQHRRVEVGESQVHPSVPLFAVAMLMAGVVVGLLLDQRHPTLRALTRRVGGDIGVHGAGVGGLGLAFAGHGALPRLRVPRWGPLVGRSGATAGSKGQGEENEQTTHGVSWGVERRASERRSSRRSQKPFQSR